MVCIVIHMSPENTSPQSKGGKARADNLSAEDRSAIASAAANARWGESSVPRASHDGELDIAGIPTPIKAAVLPNGKRLLAQGTFLMAIGRSRTPKAGTGGTISVDGLPFFLQAEQLKPFISDELRLSTTPILFRLKNGQKAVGYDAALLPMVCEVYLKLRDSFRDDDKPVPAQYRHIVTACDILMRGLARVGIIALVDEATGYQEVRDRQALQEVLRKYISGALFEWSKTFPLEFYRELFRLKGWTWNNGKMPGAVGGYTNDLIYQRLAPGVYDELQRVNPPTEKGYRQYHNHRFMTRDIGHPALTRHIYRVLGIMEGSSGWDDFKRKIDAKLPKLNQTIAMDLDA